MIPSTKINTRDSVDNPDITIMSVQTKNSIPIHWKAIGLVAIPIITYFLYNLFREYPNPCKPLPQDWREACKIRPLTQKMLAECKLIINSSLLK